MKLTNILVGLLFSIVILGGSIIVSFFFEEDLSSAAGTNVSIDVIGDSFTNSTSTTDGYVYYPAILAGDYTLVFEADGYAQRFASVTIGTQEIASKTLYLVNDTLADDVEFIVIDQTASPVEGAIVKALRYYTADGMYYQVDEESTDFDGTVLLDIFKFTDLYIFIVEYNGVTELTTQETNIKKDTVTLQINIGEAVLSQYTRYNSIDYALTYDSNTYTFNSIFNNVDGLASQICLDVDRTNVLNGTIDVSYQCSTATSGTINATVTNTSSYVYRARLYAEDPDTGSFNLLSIRTVEFPDSTTPGRNGLFWQFLLSLLTLGMMLRNPKIVLIAIPISLMIGKLLYLNSFDWPTLSGLFVVGLIILMGLRR